MVRPSNTDYCFPWADSDPCPCDGRNRFDRCCKGRDGRPAMAVGSLVPPGPPTGEARKGCYLASSLNCGGGLSREHYISRALIDQRDVFVRGMPWQKAEVQRLSPDSLTAKILCRRHNSALSPLDAHAQRLFLGIEEASHHASKRSLSRKPQFFMTSGDAVELWAMKTLAGLYASEIDFETPGYKFRAFAVPMDAIARELTSDRPNSFIRMIVPLGEEEHEALLGRRAVSIGPIVDGESDKLLGLLIRLHGFAFYFFIDPVVREEAANEITRPDIIDFIGPVRTSRIYLSWRDKSGPSQIVHVRVTDSRGKIRVPTDPIPPLGQPTAGKRGTSG